MSFIEEQTIGNRCTYHSQPKKKRNQNLQTTEFSSITNLYAVTYFSIKFSNDGSTACNIILGKESKVKIETRKMSS